MNTTLKHIRILAVALLAGTATAWGQSSGTTSGRESAADDAQVDSMYQRVMQPLDLPSFDEMLSISETEIIRMRNSAEPDTSAMPYISLMRRTTPGPLSIYELPYSLTGSSKNWKQLWVNTGVLAGAFVGTLFVLECLPEDATSWNRAELQKVPLFQRWKDHVITEGPEWDHDKFMFNYVLHPYAGAAYFMSARSCGFNFYQSMLYSALISTVGWEFGIEAFMERPSYQDLFITPIVGSALGEAFYRLKRTLVENDYKLFGSPVLGNIVAFLIDPLNEVIGLFRHNYAREVAHRYAWEQKKKHTTTVNLTPTWFGLALKIKF